MARVLLLLAAAVACGRNDPVPLPGSDGGACYGNGTCNLGLFCNDGGSCVEPSVGECDKELLWSSGFETDEAAPAQLSGTGSIVTSPPPHSGERSVFHPGDSGDTEIDAWPVTALTERSFFRVWVSNLDGDDNDVLTVYVQIDEGTWYPFTTVDLDPGRSEWTLVDTLIETPTGSRIEVEIEIDSDLADVQVDDLEIFAVHGSAGCP